jgi:ATP-dependent Clp protease adaptor protein ClpS
METSTLTVIENDARQHLREPGMYAVVMYNDDITTTDFVVEILITVFDKPPDLAAQLMTEIHESGQGIAGVYTYDVAVTKKTQTDKLSNEKGYPLRLTVRPSQE